MQVRLPWPWRGRVRVGVGGALGLNRAMRRRAGRGQPKRCLTMDAMLRPKVFAVYVLAFVGGFVIMSLELLGGRALAPWFGASAHVWGSVIAVFMLALSAGYLLGGRLSLRRPTLGKLGIAFLAGAVLIHPLTYAAEPAMAWVFDSIEDPRYGSLVTALALFGAPTVALGVISPYAVRLLVQAVEASGQVAGALYFVSTLGSALGTLATSFYLVLWFETNAILTGLALALLGGALLAFAADRSA